jgi:hypothetical protein
MTPEELQNGQAITFRTGLAGRTGVIWGPWRTGVLYLVRRETALKRKNPQPSHLAGAILTLTVLDVHTAEFSQDDYCGEGVFNSEEYYLEIEGLR